MPDNGEKEIPVRVAVRSRPLLQWELNEGSKECVNFIHEAKQVIVNNSKAFTYDYVFDSKTRQEVVYEKAVLPLITGIFKGYNGTVLAYGQTGSGKTYSMGSAHCVSKIGVTDDTTGVIPRVIKDIFNGIEQRDTHEFSVKVSYVEIYKEEVKDLLASSNCRKKQLMIRENTDGSIRIAGLTEAVVNDVMDTLDYMERGNSNRTTGSTAMNSTSSRSHAIFTIVLESRCINAPDEVTCSKFHLVDLAGSERAKRTKAEGDRLQEGIKINAGLLALGNVISALGDGQHGQHIPYRVSKLTRLLQDSLGGNSLTVMIACISPADSNDEETINTLRYADRARKIKNKAVVNRDPQTAELVTLRKEVQQLRIQLLNANGTTTCVEVVKDTQETREQVRKLEEENRQLLEEMRKLVDANTEMCEKAITTDMVRDKLETKLTELQDEAREVVDDPHDLSLAENAVEESTQRDCVHKLRQLYNKVLEIEVIERQTKSEESTENLTTEEEPQDTLEASDSAVEPATEEDNAIKAQHILQTAKLSNQLQELNKALAMKEELAKRMCTGGENITALRQQYEDRLKRLDKDLVELQNERDQLAVALEAATKNKESQKISEKRRIRLMELEGQIKELKKEKKEKEKVTKLKAQSDQKITTLHGEIQAIKVSRVKLMRQIKEENTKFQVWKKEKEKEVKQLKEKDRKRQFVIVKLERDFNKQKTVLRRKTEEAAASNRRLKEALLKQRVAADKRQQSQSKTLESANTKMKLWVEEDAEIAVRSKEAKKHLQSLEEDLRSVQDELGEINENESPSKRRRTFIKSECDESQRRRRELNDECELKEAQIKELRSKLADARDARARQQTRFLQITSIAEARSVMKHLFSLVVDSRCSEESCRTEATNLHNEVRSATSEIHRLQEELENAERSKEANATKIENAHQEQVIFLTQQLNQSTIGKEQKTLSVREADLTSQIKIQANLIEELLKQKEDLETLVQQKEKSVSAKEKIFEPIFDNKEIIPKVKKSEKKRKSADQEYYNEIPESQEDDDDVLSDYDPEYVPTPIVRKTKRLRRLQKNSCACKKRCNSKQCSCKKLGEACTDLCGCDPGICENSEPGDQSETSGLPSFDSTASSNKINDVTFVTTGDSGENKENEEATLYYTRMSLFPSEEADKPAEKQSLDCTLRLPSAAPYKPVYFDSPVSEQDNNNAGDDSGASRSIEERSDSTFEKQKPKRFGKKRKLNPVNNLLI